MPARNEVTCHCDRRERGNPVPFEIVPRFTPRNEKKKTHS